MSQTTVTDRVESGTDLKGFSCFTCRQRKVKCDRHNPCNNCSRTARQCSFVAPVRGKPKRRKAPKEGLHAKLRRYEEMLKSYGAKIEPSDMDNNTSDVETLSDHDANRAEDSESLENSRDGSIAFDNSKRGLITKNGSSRYFDKYFHHPGESGHSKSVDGTNDPTSNLFGNSSDEHTLVLSTFSKIENLSGLHHPLHIIPKMLDVYVDRVDPMMKFLHVPTFRSALTNALQNPQEMSKSLEALIFAFYVVTIISLEDNECYNLLGEEKRVISARYKLAARQALINAQFLKSSSLTTIQAYAMFLMAMKSDYEGDSLFLLSGIAVRLGRRIGLHRDGTLIGLSPFETEIRRRLWWHIVHIDTVAADLSGTKPSMELLFCDTKAPLNVEDEDFSPNMVDTPPERAGITSTVLCLIRCDVRRFLHKIIPQATHHVRWDNLTSPGITLADKDNLINKEDVFETKYLWDSLMSPSITLADKDNLINEMEDVFETKYLRYIDPSNPLHYFASFMLRSAVGKMRLYAHHPRQFADSGVKVPQRSRDIIFANGTKILEYGNLMCGDHRLRKFDWYINLNHMCNTLFFVLIETRHRKIGPEVDHAWQLINGIFENYPSLLGQATEPLYAALGSWTLQVWDECAAARKRERLPELPMPEYISTIRGNQRLVTDLPPKQNGPRDPNRAFEDLANYGEDQFLGHNGNASTDFEFMNSYDFSSLLSFDLEPSEWVQWERLISGQGV